jgi:hypothetical protein
MGCSPELRQSADGPLTSQCHRGGAGYGGGRVGGGGRSGGGRGGAVVVIIIIAMTVIIVMPSICRNPES